MMITRVTSVVNPHPAHRSSGRGRAVVNRRHSSARSSSNPAMLTLGFLNPKGERSNMAKTKGRASRPRRAYARVSRRSKPNPRRHGRRSRPNPRRGKRNPQFLGSAVKPMKMVELVAGGLVGLGVNNLAMTALPTTLTSNAFGAVAASIAVALASGYAGGFVDKEFGAAVAFGGLMAAGQIAINQWVPSVGSTIGLSGVRGMGDFVPGKFPVPQTPVVLSTGGPMGGGTSGAYPMPYGIAA
jgi:hypothetical protein